MTRLLITLTALSIAMLSIGCVRTSHKLSDVGEPVTDDEIVGVWEQHDPIFGVADTLVCIEACADGTYLQRSLDPERENRTPFRLVKIADTTYMEVDLVEAISRGESEISESENKSDLLKDARMAFPIRWERRGEWIANWDADDATIEKFIAEDKLKGQSDGPWPFQTTVTSTAEELETCLENHGDEIYAAAINDSRGHLRRVFRRVSTQVPSTTQETTRTP